MEDESQTGWKFEAYDDDAPTDGYYTFRAGPGGPLYAMVEPQDNGAWQAAVYLEDGDELIGAPANYPTLAAAQEAAILALLAILESWISQVLVLRGAADAD